MTNWEEVCINDIASHLGDGLHGTPLYDNTGDYYFINGNNLCNGKIALKEDTKRCNESEYKKYRKNLNDRSILVSINGTIGNVAVYNNEKCILGKSACYFNVKEDVSKQFIKYVVSTPDFKAYLFERANGSTIMNVPLSAMRQYTFKLPLLPEQVAIAEVLSSLDDKIDLLHRNNKTLEEMAEVLFHKWFILDADINWNTERLGELFDIGIGRTPPRKESKWFTENPDDVKWVSIKDMGSSGVYVLKTAETLTRSAIETFNIPVVPSGTTLLSFKMTVGRVAISSESMITNEAIAHFKIKPDSNLFSEFIYLYLKTFKWEQLGSTSSIVDAINSQMIREIEISVPSETSLLHFRHLIKPVFEVIRQNQEQINCLRNLRNLLLPKLMSGAIRVKLGTHELSVL